MGTRADFYTKNKSKLTWLGSIGWDGYPEGIDETVFNATDQKSFKTAVKDFLKREDATLPKEGWPWPWDNSNTTDYSYVFDVQQKQVFISSFGCPFFLLKENQKYDKLFKEWNDTEEPIGKEPDFDEYLEKIGRTEKFNFPDMKKIQRVKLGGKGSGLIIVGPRGIED